MIKYYNPTSPGRRGMSTLVRNSTKAEKSTIKRLTTVLAGTIGRSNGKISVHHKRRGHKKKYRIVDFKRNNFDIMGTVASLDYDPCRTTDLALVNYVNGDKRYILAPEGLKIGDSVVSGENVEIKVGNALPLKSIPVGSTVHNIELYPKAGGRFVRSAGVAASVTAKEGKYVNVKMPSGEVRKFLNECYATIGNLSNFEWNLVNFGKAGRRFHMGIRPTTRGKSRSAYDHPLGSSYRQKMGRQPVDLWGNLSKGKKTRSRTHTDKYIVKDRRSK